MKTHPGPTGSCRRGASNGSRPVTARGTAAGLTGLGEHAASNSGSPFLPNKNSDQSKASTRHRTPFAATDRRVYCSANTAGCRARFGAVLNDLPVCAPEGRRVLGYQPPADHTVCWVALSTGSLAVPERVEAGELAVFEPSNQAIDFYAEADTEFVLGSAASHPYELALGNYSVHTSPATLQAGERRIAEIQARLQTGRPSIRGGSNERTQGQGRHRRWRGAWQHRRSDGHPPR